MRSSTPAIVRDGQNYTQFGPGAAADPDQQSAIPAAGGVLSPSAAPAPTDTPATYLMTINPAGPVNVDLPLESASRGRYIWIDVQAAQNVTLRSSAGVSIGAGLGTATNPLNNNQGLVYCDGTSWQLIADY